MNDVPAREHDEAGELPPGWTRAAPVQIGRTVLGKMLDRAKHRRDRELAYLRNINIRWGFIDTDDLSKMYFENDELDRYGISPGDLLICEGGEPGRCAVWSKEDTSLKFQKALHRLRPERGINPHYLMYHIWHDAKAGRLERYFTGSMIKHFTRQSLAKYRLRLAPSNEQDRIVKKIDELFSDIEQGEAALRLAKALLQRYRQAVLQAAVAGELTRDWREQHTGEIETGEQLLARILEARRAAWEQAKLAKMAAQGQRPKDDSWKRRYKEPVPPETSNFPELPESWAWATLPMLGEFGRGKSKHRPGTIRAFMVVNILLNRPVRFGEAVAE